MNSDLPKESPQSDDSGDRRTLKWPQLSLPAALTVLIATACIVVAIAYLFYHNNPNRKYDIERGDMINKNEALSVEDEEADATSALDAPSTKRKIEYLEKELKALSGLNTFNESELSDQNLQLMPAEQPSR